MLVDLPVAAGDDQTVGPEELPASAMSAMDRSPVIACEACFSGCREDPDTVLRHGPVRIDLMRR